MKPTDRYQIRQSLANRQWGILDRQAPNHNGGFQYVVENLRTVAQARAVKAALVEAYYAGANAIKTGELII